MLINRRTGVKFFWGIEKKRILQFEFRKHSFEGWIWELRLAWIINRLTHWTRDGRNERTERKRAEQKKQSHVTSELLFFHNEFDIHSFGWMRMEFHDASVPNQCRKYALEDTFISNNSPYLITHDFMAKC